MSTLPRGTVTFLFTDIEGSTRLLREIGPGSYAEALEQHRSLLREACQRHGGVELGAQGDGLLFVFDRASTAIAATREGQLSLENGAISVRMGVHTGEPLIAGGEYVGIDLHKAARIAAVAHGGQVLISQQAASLADASNLIDLGLHRLKDLSRPERIFQLVIASLRTEFPPLRTLDSHPHNLPLQPTPLIGREMEIRAIAARALDPLIRLLTLTGPAGSGKTRLSLAAAAELLESFSDGIFFINFAPIADPRLVTSVIAQTIGVRDDAERNLDVAIRDHLQDKRVLLVLDNLEHLVSSAADIGHLIATVPGLTMLATSRIPLRLRGEHEYPVLPLSLPDVRDIHDVDSLARFESVQLFRERARAVQPDFDITLANARAVAEICVRLDGLPLAIELAAARIRVLTAEAILARLTSRLKLLTAGPHDVPSRQQTLRGAIDWSYDLLREEEQVLFRRLAVFSGRAVLEAIEEVCCDGGFDPDVLDRVSSLVEKSLLRTLAQEAGEPAALMLETMHEYAREKLENSGEAVDIATRHLGYFLALAEQAAPDLAGPQQQRWLSRLERDHDNLRAALRFSLESGDIERGLRLAGALPTFWIAHGHLREGSSFFREIVVRASACSPAALAKALVGAGALARQQGDFDSAERLIRQSLDLSRELADDRATVTALLNLGAVLGERGDFGGAEPAFEEALALLRDLRDERLLAMVLTNLGVTAEVRGDFQRAAALYEESLEICRVIGDGAGTSLALSNLGHIAVDNRDYATAGRRFRDSILMARESGHTYLSIHEVANLAIVAALRGQALRATRLFAAYETHLEAIGAMQIDTDRDTYTRARAAARDALSEAEWSRAWEKGTKMPLEEALTYALSDGGDGAES